MLSAVFVVITPAVAAPKDLPEQAKLHVPEFKVQIIEYEGLRAVVKPVYTTLDDPANHVTPSGVFDGVGKLSIEWPAGFVGCSGTLLDTGKHVLSAAHCFTDDNGNPIGFPFCSVCILEEVKILTTRAKRGRGCFCPRCNAELDIENFAWAKG